MEPRKQAICDALRTWINQRPGFDPNNYDRAGYLSDSRMVLRQLHDARELLRAVELSSITADALIAAFPRAFSGRLVIHEKGIQTRAGVVPRLEYCTGQYWCTEYRAAACAVLASALWTHTSEECMPEVSRYVVRPWGFKGSPPGFATRADATAFRDHKGGESWGQVIEQYRGNLSAGDWLRAHFKQQFGRGIASRWFS